MFKNKLGLLFLVLFFAVQLNFLAQDANDPFYKYGFVVDPIYSDITLALENSKEVKKLKLENIDLKPHQSKLHKFKNLAVLKLSHNQLDSLPVEMLTGGALLYFESIENPIKQLPNDIGNCRGLKEFKGIKLALDSFPHSFSSLSQLKRIELQQNLKDSFTVNQGFRGFYALEEILLYKVKLTAFPTGISDSKKLRNAYFVDCNLTVLDTSICGVNTLEVLVLEGNQIKSLPKNLIKLQRLEALVLKNNQLTHLPEWISKLKNLKKLDVSGNQIPRNELEIIRILLPNCKVTY